MSNIAASQQVIQVEHVTIRSTKPFAEVKARLERSVPKLDEESSNSWLLARRSD